MPAANTLPPSWSVAGVTGTHMNRMPERLTRNMGGVTYEMAPFPRSLVPSRLLGAYTTETAIDVLARFQGAAAYVGGRCAASAPCNSYFSSLGKNMTLADLLAWQVVFYYWLPISRIGPVPRVGERMEVLQAEVISTTDETRFTQIVVGEFSLASNIKLAATMVHELAHVAGAPGANADLRAQASAEGGAKLFNTLIAAEMALKACLLPRQFDPGALGLMQGAQSWRGRGVA